MPERNPQVIAHRGGRRWAPENTLAAFKRSVDAHADGIELDIHRCKSGELIVIHDETLPRTTNGAGFIKDKTLAELKALDAGSWYKPEFKDERLPTLEEVLHLVDGKLNVNVEIKNIPVDYPGIEDALIETLSHYKYPDKIIVSSFDHQVLKSFHRKAPQYKIGMLDAAIPADIGTYAKIVGATAWNPEFDVVRPDAVAAAHAAGLKVFVWTPNDKKDWANLADMHVDGIITDDPVGLMSAFKR
jgi:glycerophosphoryl diester phosphodiesterase